MTNDNTTDRERLESFSMLMPVYDISNLDAIVEECKYELIDQVEKNSTQFYESVREVYPDFRCFDFQYFLENDLFSHDDDKVFRLYLRYKGGLIDAAESCLKEWERFTHDDLKDPIVNGEPKSVIFWVRMRFDIYALVNKIEALNDKLRCDFYKLTKSELT